MLFMNKLKVSNDTRKIKLMKYPVHQKITKTSIIYQSSKIINTQEEIQYSITITSIIIEENLKKYIIIT